MPAALNKLTSSIATALAGLTLSSCVSLNSVSLTSIPSHRQTEVHAQSSRLIVLGFNFDNDFVNQLESDLRRQCADGRVSGILTKDETIDYFLMLVHKRQVTATGYCDRGSQRGQANLKASVADSIATRANANVP